MNEFRYSEPGFVFANSPSRYWNNRLVRKAISSAFAEDYRQRNTEYETKPISKQVSELRIDVPQGLVECPSLLVREAKRMEIRLSIEIILISLAGTIPPGILVIFFG